MKKLLLSLGLLAFATVSYAQNLNLTLTLDKMQVSKLTEKSSDELYFSVVEFPSEGKGAHKTIPEYPLYWSSDHIDKIADLTLWKSSLKPGQSAEVLVSLVEHDVPPWNTDDLLGAFKLHVMNKDGKLITKWDGKNAENKIEAVKGKNNQNTYTLIGEGGKYMLSVSLDSTQK